MKRNADIGVFTEPSTMRIRIEKQFTLLEKEKGKYHAFPTVIRQDRQLWLACRSGTVSGRQDHGMQGKVLLLSGSVDQPDAWTLRGKLFESSLDGSGNELDAILSNPEPDLIFLATRDYEWQRRNDVYLSRGRSPLFSRRTLLTTISDQQATCFGHIRKTISDDLLMPGYCGFDDEPSGTPVLLVSKNRGDTWRLRSKVASSTAVGTRLTEYSLAYLGDTRWTALIRNETPPCELYRTESSDDGRTWSAPTKTKLRGHAPMLHEADDIGGHLAVYRDLSEQDPGVGVGLSVNKGVTWERAGRLASYCGSIYDGGYGDLVHLETNRYLAVYYICDGDASPWIEGSTFTLE
jgi:hypothetical protein